MVERTLLRIGAVALTAGLVTAVVFEVLHPAREDPSDNPLVFAEYAGSVNWTTIHLGALAGALMLLGGLAMLSESLRDGPTLQAAWSRLAAASAVVAAAAYGVLQVVDGVALKYAVDTWAAAPSDTKTAAFAAAESVRWIEYGLNSLTFSLVGITLVLVGVALLTGDRFPRWQGVWAVAAGIAYLVRGLLVAYQGFAANPSGLVALILFGCWVLVIAAAMWRRGSRLNQEPDTTRPHETARPAGT
jgi:hypothetical protein